MVSVPTSLGEWIHSPWFDLGLVVWKGYRPRVRLVLAGGHASAWFSPFWRGPAPGAQRYQAINPRKRRPMLSRCQLVMATGGSIAQDLTMQWSTLGGFMQELSLLVIDEGQQYGTDREIAVISLLKQQPLVIWTGDSQQTPGGIAQAAPNAKRSRQLLLAKKHRLRSDRNYFMPSNLAEAMIKLLDHSSNEGLAILSQVLGKGEHALGNLWTDQLTQQAVLDL